MAADPNAQNATDIQSKFELYFITLIFTILGLAIQTSKNSPFIVVAVMELTSWLFLTTAGLIAMYRVVRLPIILNGFAAINRNNVVIEQVENDSRFNRKMLDTDNSLVDHADIIKKYERKNENLNAKNKSINSKLIDLFKIQWWLFILALVGLIVSRGFDYILHLICYLKQYF